MKNSGILVLLSALLLAACGDKDQVCIMKEVLVTYPPDEPYLKRVLTHDGTHYTEVKDYLFNNNTKEYDEEPYQFVTISYASGKVSKTVLRNPQGNDNAYVESTFTYSVVNEITMVDIHEKSFVDGAVTSERIYERHFIESPKDAIYLTTNELGEPILEQYENGNLIKVGFQSPDGTYEAHDTTWVFALHYKYDNLPNAITEYALLDLVTEAPNFGRCANNVIELITNPDTQPVSIKQKFSVNASNSLMTYTYEGTGRAFTVNYECR